MLVPAKANASWLSLILAVTSTVGVSGQQIQLGLKAPCDEFLNGGGVQCKAQDGSLVSWTQDTIITAALHGSWTKDADADGYCP